MPSLLATAGVHHHLVRLGKRTRCALVVESGDAREVHHCALLLGYGAGAVNPYLAFETLDDMIRQRLLVGVTHEQAVVNYIHALNKGILKVMSKMGISTLQSYCGAQIFEAVGLDRAFVDRYFTRTSSRIGGVGAAVVAEEIVPAAPEGVRDPRRRLGRPRLRRRVSVAARRRVPPLQPGDGVQAAARDAQRSVLGVQGVHAAGGRPEPAARDAARPARAEDRRGAGSARRGRAGRIDREALRDRRDVVRLDQPGSARDARDRDEPARREVEHRRRRRRSGPLHARRQRRLAQQRDQAGGIGQLRRHQRIPGQRRRSADQDGAGRQAGRRRAAARPQGLPVDREGPLCDARRRPDLAAAAPRHLLDRRPGAADLRPEERQSARADPRQARRRRRRRHRRRRRGEGARRRRADLGTRRRHRRGAADRHQARRRAVGAGARGNAAGPDAQQPARPHRRAGRRPAEDRPRRRRRRADGRGGVRVRDRAARGVGLRDDARLPPEHLPGRRRDAGSRAAEELHRQGGVHRQFLPVHRRGSARVHGGARLPHDRRDGRARRLPQRAAGGESLEGARSRFLGDPASARGAGRRRRGGRRAFRITASSRRSTTSSSPDAPTRSSGRRRCR